jgi:hypothetical protein
VRLCPRTKACQLRALVLPRGGPDGQLHNNRERMRVAWQYWRGWAMQVFLETQRLVLPPRGRGVCAG